MSTNSKKIKAELDKTNARIAELQPQFDDLRAAFNTAQTDFTQKKAIFEDLLAAQAPLNAMSAAINGLLGTAGRLEAEYGAAVEAEARQEMIGRLKTATNSIRPAFAHYLQKRSDVDKALRAMMETKEAAQAEDYIYASILNELESAGVSKEEIQPYLVERPEVPDLEFGQAIAAAERADALRLSQLQADERDRRADLARAEAGKRRDAASAAYTEMQHEKAVKQQRWVGGNRVVSKAGASGKV